jgi:hypothetical protein
MIGICGFCFVFGVMGFLSPLFWKGKSILEYCGLILYGTISLYCGVGVVQRKEWARKLLKYLFGFCYGAGAVSLFFSKEKTGVPTGILVFMAVFAIGAIFYCIDQLNSKAVKEYFNK